MTLTGHQEVGSPFKFMVGGIFLTIASLAYVGLLTNDPTNPAPLAILFSLPVLYGAILSFSGRKRSTVQKISAYAVLLPLGVFLGALGGLWGFGILMSAVGFFCSITALLILASKSGATNHQELINSK